MPPSFLTIETDDFMHSGDYSFPSSFIQKATHGKHGGLEYDIILEWPGADPEAEYYIDVETRSDFLTGQFAFVLLYEDKHQELEMLGKSYQVATSTGSGQQAVHRLKLLEREGELADDINLSGAVLRLRLPRSSVDIQDTLQEQGLVERGHELCHNFYLSVRAEKRAPDHDLGTIFETPARLMRVRWEGSALESGLFDPRSRITAFLEFDRSMKGADHLLKTGEWAVLVPDGAQPGHSERVSPISKKLSETDSSTLILDFAADTLSFGSCHKLLLSGGGAGMPDFDTQLLAEDLKLCTTSCHCDRAGTATCDESTKVCFCRPTHTGMDCGQCLEGHSKDPVTGECKLASKCAELGG